MFLALFVAILNENNYDYSGQKPEDHGDGSQRPPVGFVLVENPPDDWPLRWKLAWSLHNGKPLPITGGTMTVSIDPALLAVDEEKKK